MSAVLNESRQARDLGIARAECGVENEHPGWSATAYYVVRGFIRTRKGETFTAEDVREFAYKRGLPVPRDERCWGSVLKTVASDRYIRKVGYTQSVGRVSHMRPVTLWKVVG